MVVGFLERRNFDHSPTYVKDKVRYEVEVSYYLENSKNYNVSYGLHTVGFQDRSQISYQKTRMKYTEVIGKEFLINSYNDQNDNLLYLIEVNLTAHEKVLVRQIFEITRLNIIVNNLEDYKSSSYRTYNNDMDKYLAQEPEREVLINGFCYTGKERGWYSRKIKESLVHEVDKYGDLIFAELVFHPQKSITDFSNSGMNSNLDRNSEDYSAFFEV